MPAKIIVSRKSEFMNRTRGFKVLIDGEVVGKISNGKTEEYHVVAGSHTIECKIDWCSSEVYQVQAKEDDTIYLRVKSGMKYFLPLYIIFLLWLVSGIFIRNKSEILGDAHPWIQGVVLGIPLLYMLYYFTLGKKKYLVIDKDKTNVFAK